MTLKEFLVRHNMTSEEFAKAMRVTHSTVSKWRAGTRVPRLAHIKKVARLTKNKVSLSDWI